MKTCCFTGPRMFKLNFGSEDSSDCICFKKKIKDEIYLLYKRGFRKFISGMADGTDTFCAEAVIELKKIYPDVYLELALPYNSISRKTDMRFLKISALADKVTMVNNKYSPDCYYKRNKYMVDHSDLLLAVFSESGGTAYTIKYAAKTDKPIRIITGG